MSPSSPSSPQQANSRRAARIQLRLQESLKKRIEAVARAKGLSVTDYALGVLAEKVNEDFERQTTIHLARSDREAFFSVLDDEQPLGDAWERSTHQASQIDG